MASFPVANQPAFTQDCKSRSKCLLESTPIHKQLFYHLIRLLLLPDSLATCYCAGSELNFDDNWQTTIRPIKSICYLFHFVKFDFCDTDLWRLFVRNLPKTKHRLDRDRKVAARRVCARARYAKTSLKRIYRNRTRRSAFGRQHSIYAEKQEWQLHLRLQFGFSVLNGSTETVGSKRLSNVACQL